MRKTLTATDTLVNYSSAKNFCRNLANTKLCMFKFLICENNLGCDETNSAKGYLNPIKLLDSTQEIFHPITNHTLIPYRAFQSVTIILCGV